MHPRCVCVNWGQAPGKADRCVAAWLRGCALSCSFDVILLILATMATVLRPSNLVQDQAIQHHLQVTESRNSSAFPIFVKESIKRPTERKKDQDAE